MRRRRLLGCVVGLAVMASAGVASADPHEVRVPLVDGRLSTADLLARVHLPGAVAKRLPHGSVDLRSFGGSLFVAGLDRALGDGCHVEVTPDALVVHVDADRLPHDLDGAERATRTFTATVAPEATAAQARRFGLALPRRVDERRPLVVVLHGVDMASVDMTAMHQLLATAGYQTADFEYPPDGPIADDVAMLTRHLAAVHEAFPGLTVDVVAFSMGGLVARGYVEGVDYAGGVDRLVMIATPNHGSAWAPLEPALKVRMATEQAAADAGWRPTWFITGGLGEAGRDLEPGSPFLTALNARPRRAGVRYTIVDGDRTAIDQLAAAALSAPARWVPPFARGWWGVRQAESGLSLTAAKLRDRPAESDGPVSRASAALDGVGDVVTVHADHSSMYHGDGGRPPAAWAVVRDRLATP